MDLPPPEVPDQDAGFQVETDPARAVIDDDGDEPLMRQETDGRKPFAVPQSRRRKKAVAENASCREICRDNVMEILIGIAALVTIGILIGAFVYYPSRNERSMSHAAKVHHKHGYDVHAPGDAQPSSSSDQPAAAPAVSDDKPDPLDDDSGKDNYDDSSDLAHHGHKKYYIRVFDPILQRSIKRSYNVYTPPSVQRPKTPAVVICHADGDSFRTTSEWFLMDRLARKEGFLVIYPEGLQSGPSSNNGMLTPSWNALGTGAGDKDTCFHTKYSLIAKQPTCKQAGHHTKETLSTHCDRTPCAADTAFVSEMIKRLVTDLSVDELQVHATGQGIGGMFAEQLGITLSSQIASVVQVSGAPLIGYNDLPASPVSLLSIRGSSDSTIPANAATSYNNNIRWCPNNCSSKGSLVSQDGYKYVPEMSVAKTWALAAGCSALGNKKWHPSVHISGESKTFFTDEFNKIHANCTQVGTDCRSNTEIVSCMVDGGHTLPWSKIIGSSKSHQRKWDSVAEEKLLWPRLAWSFMSSHPK